MKHTLSALALAAAIGLAPTAHAQRNMSALSTLSLLPVASLVFSASAVATIPMELSKAGSVLVVKSVDASARGTVYVLERASDGARASVEVVARGAASASLATGTLVTVSVIGAGVLLSAAGEVIAFVPNELGRALLHNERLS